MGHISEISIKPSVNLKSKNKFQDASVFEEILCETIGSNKCWEPLPPESPYPLQSPGLCIISPLEGSKSLQYTGFKGTA